MNEFESIGQEIVELINVWETKLLKLSHKMITTYRNSQQRTIKQILGHLIDSASNNIHRVIHLQYQKSPLVFPNYASNGNNDRWIAIQNYQEENWTQMVLLWKFLFLHFCHVIQQIDNSKLTNEWIAAPDKTISLKKMVDDFLPHMKLHLAEIDALISYSK